MGPASYFQVYTKMLTKIRNDMHMFVLHKSMPKHNCKIQLGTYAEGRCGLRFIHRVTAKR